MQVPLRREQGRRRRRQQRRRRPQRRRRRRRHSDFSLAGDSNPFHNVWRSVRPWAVLVGIGRWSRGPLWRPGLAVRHFAVAPQQAWHVQRLVDGRLDRVAVVKGNPGTMTLIINMFSNLKLTLDDKINFVIKFILYVHLKICPNESADKDPRLLPRPATASEAQAAALPLRHPEGSISCVEFQVMVRSAF